MIRHAGGCNQQSRQVHFQLSLLLLVCSLGWVTRDSVSNQGTPKVHFRATERTLQWKIITAMPPFPVPADLPVIRSQFEFIKEVLYKEEKPYFCGASLPPEKQHLRTNEVFDTIETNITDLRGYENLLSLDEHLVQFVEHDSKYVGGNGLSTPENLLGYINETSGLIKAVLGADQCVCYSYRVCNVDIASTFVVANQSVFVTCLGF